MKTTEECVKAIEKLLEKFPNMRNKELLTALGVSAGTILRRGIVITEIRNRLGIPERKKKTGLFEKDVATILNELGIEFQREVTYKDLKDKRYLRFDFYIPKWNLLIEADGPQHYTDVTSTPNFKFNPLIQKHDEMKNMYAKTNNIALLRIRYFRYYQPGKVRALKKLLITLQCTYLETGKLNLFNCWNGSKLIPISSQDSKE